MPRATILWMAAFAVLVACHGAAEVPEAPGERAVSLAEQARRAPNDVELLLKLARTHVAVAREWSVAGSDPQAPLLDARDAYRRLLELAPRSADALLEAAAVEQALGDDDAARRLLLEHLRSAAGTSAADPRASAEVDAMRSDLFAALGAPAAAVRAAGRALSFDPEAVALHQRRTDLCFQAGEIGALVAACDALRESAPESATAAWYAGCSRLLAGDAARRERSFEAARSDYEAARTQLAAAEAALIDRLAKAPDLALEPDGFRRTLVDALARLGADLEHAGDFAAGARVMQALTCAEPDRAFWWNNLGFFLREQASLIAAGRIVSEGDTKKNAEAIFRRSWAAYQTAARLAPDDARIINDAALIQVYHLRDELDRAEKMLYEAIRVGDAELAAMGASPPETERYPVAQAVGDAWQNLAYLYYHVRPDLPKVKECVEKSIATRTDSREGLRVYIEAAEGRHEPIPERSVAAAVLAPRREDPPKGQVAWERSFADASARAACAVADRARHCAVDRDANGRRILCPRYGLVTCGEHQRACDELAAAWPALKQPADGDLPPEGLLLWKSDGTRVAARGRMTASDEWFAPAAATDHAGSASAADLMPLLSDLLWNEGPAQTQAAATLLSLPGTAARAAVEAILKLAPGDSLPVGAAGAIGGHDLVVPTSAVAAMVAAIAARDDASARELLVACVGVHTDPDACALALACWPAGGDLERVKRVLQRSDQWRVGAAAAAALRRVDASAETAAWLELVEAVPS